MDNRRAGAVVKPIEVLFGEGTVAGVDDAQLLERFAARRDEVAFAALLDRHGPMVLAACRGLLGDAHKAEDAFQATFLVLARRAGSIRHPDRLGPWLHGVARHAAARARRSESRRIRREGEAAMAKAYSGRHAEPTLDREAAEAMHEEIGRLPERYRTPVVLCDLQGLARAEVARRLQWPLGTVNGRLSRARDLLRRRLARRGITLATTALAAGIGTAVVPSALAAETVGTAAGFATGVVTAAGSARGVILAGEVLRGLIRTKTISVVAGIGALSLGLIGSAVLVGQQAGLRSTREAGPQEQALVSPLDSLKAADIPADERRPGQSANLVAVLGEHRGRHGGAVRGLAVSPDGRLVATAADQDKDIKLWDSQTLRLRATLIGHRSSVNGLAISPDGHTLVSGSSYGDFLTWDLRGETPRGPTFLAVRGSSGFNNQFHSVAFSPDGKTLAVAGDGKGVALFDTSGPAPRPRAVLPGLVEEVRTLAFAPDGATLALVVPGDGSVRLWDVDGDAPRERASLPPAVLPGRRTQGPNALAFAPVGKTLAVVEDDPDRGITLWDLAGPRPLEAGRLGVRPPEVPGIAGVMELQRALAVTFAPNGHALFVGLADGSIRTWALTADGPEERATFTAHRGAVDRLAFTPDGKTLLTGGPDHLVRSWDATADVPKERVVPDGPVGGLKAIAFAPDGTTLAVGGDDQVVRLWDLAAPRSSTPKAQVAARNRVNALAFSPDGRTLVVDDDVWDIGGAEFATLGRLPGRGDTWSLAYAPDGKTLISGRYGQEVQLWDMTDREPRLRLELGGRPAGNPGFPGQDGPPAVVAISPVGKFLASSVEGKSVRLWDLSGLNPREVALLEGTGWGVSALAFAPDGKTLAAGTNGGTLLWDLSAEVPRLVRTIKECLGFSMAFTRDGSRLIAADEVMGSGRPLDPSHPAVCVYEVATGRRIDEWKLSAPCWALALAPDGRHVAAAKQDGTVDLFRLTPGR